MSGHNIGDAPIEPDLYGMMNDLARALDRFFNGAALGDERKIGFILMAFHFGEDPEDKHRCNYISNARREDVVVLLKEQLARFEGQSLTGGRS